jgi:alkanesulfonate monooxygenase SsuD/methylene tetrahydromethanopterin reductase-like flavin-dependent oxidoreductase (luciferase family)
MSQQREPHPWVAESAHRVRFAVHSIFVENEAQTVKAARRAEQLNFDAYWAHDHPTRLMDCWGQLMMLAMATETLRLISLVSCIYYRSPLLLARQAADVDRVSGGRLVLGLGIGDDVPEFDQMCIPFPPLKERREALEETLDIVRGLWTGHPFSYEGKHFRPSEDGIRRLPVQDPYVPVLIGGGGERVTLRQVARLADVSNFAPHEWSGSAFSVTDVARKYEALRWHCTNIGRPYESVLRTHFTPLLILAENKPALERKSAQARIPDVSLRQELLFATPEVAISHFQALADVGVQYFLASINVSDEETVRLLAEAVVPFVVPGNQSKP